MATKNDALILELLADPLFRVEPDGRVLTKKGLDGMPCDEWRIAGGPKNDANANQYWRVRYRGKYLVAHRVVWAKYRGALDRSLTINHIDGNGLNNAIDNLEMVTQAENNLRAFRVTGRRSSGNRKINYETARQIRIDRARGATLAILAQRFGIAKSTVSYVVNNRTWGQL